jgi:hypothetical protein
MRVHKRNSYGDLSIPTFTTSVEEYRHRLFWQEFQIHEIFQPSSSVALQPISSLGLLYALPPKLSILGLLFSMLSFQVI